MKKYLGRCFSLASIIFLVFIIYELINRGLLTAVGVEIRRYSSVNTSYLYIVPVAVIGSYAVGWVFTKLKVE